MPMIRKKLWSSSPHVVKFEEDEDTKPKKEEKEENPDDDRPVIE